MNRTKKSVLTADCIALCVVLPMAFHSIPNAGSIFCPMHIPVLLCGLICGWQYGFAVGLIVPVLRSLLFGMPVLYPGAVSMAFELATYGFVVGFLYNRSKWKCIVSLYRSMLISMISGRVVWGIVQAILLGIGKNVFTFKMFVAGAFLNAVPGIIIQLVLIPAIMVALRKAKLIPFHKSSKKSETI